MHLWYIPLHMLACTVVHVFTSRSLSSPCHLHPASSAEQRTLSERTSRFAKLSLNSWWLDTLVLSTGQRGPVSLYMYITERERERGNNTYYYCLTLSLRVIQILVIKYGYMYNVQYMCMRMYRCTCTICTCIRVHQFVSVCMRIHKEGLVSYTLYMYSFYAIHVCTCTWWCTP